MTKFHMNQRFSDYYDKNYFLTFKYEGQESMIYKFSFIKVAYFPLIRTKSSFEQKDQKKNLYESIVSTQFYHVQNLRETEKSVTKTKNIKIVFE